MDKHIYEGLMYIKENYTPINVISFYEGLKGSTATNILENVELVYEEKYGTSIVNEAIDHVGIDGLDTLEKAYETITNITTRVTEAYSNEDYDTRIQQTQILNKLEDKIQILKENQDKFLVDSTKSMLIDNFMKKAHGVKVLTEGIFTFKDNETFFKAAVDVTEHFGTMAPDITKNYEDDEESNNYQRKLLGLNFSLALIDFTKSDSEESMLESFNKMLQIGYKFDEIATEGVTSSLKRVAIKGDQAARKTASKLRGSRDQAKRVKKIVGKIPAHFDKLVDNTIGQISKLDKAERRKRIIEGGYRFKLLKLIRNGIIFGAAWSVGPALAALSLLVLVVFDTQLDDKARHSLVADLELELKMTKEKIKDAESKGDNTKKYQLMRIENKISRDLERIEFRLDSILVKRSGVDI